MNNSTKIIACVSTPFQYINLLELLEKLNLSTSQSVLIISSHNKNTLNQINEIYSTTKWEKIFIPFTINPKLWIISYFKLKILFYIYRNRLKVIGNISEIKNRSFINSSKAHYYVVDDGANSILINKYLIGIISSNSKSLNPILERLLFRNGMKLKNINFTFFTVYKHLKVGADIKILENDFNRLKRQSIYSSCKNEVNEFWLVGAHFVKLGMIKNNTYKKILNLLKESAENQGLKFVYFGHRSEINYEDEIFSNIEVRVNEIPFELCMLKSTIQPKIIASFYSSSLFNLNVLVPDYKLISFNLLTANVFNKKVNKENLNLIYEYIKYHTNIEIKDISLK